MQWIKKKYNTPLEPAELRLVRCQSTHSPQWALFLVHDRLFETEVLVKGDWVNNKADVVQGFRSRVDWLLGKGLDVDDVSGAIF
jgi:hypothetical protein